MSAPQLERLVEDLKSGTFNPPVEDFSSLGDLSAAVRSAGYEVDDNELASFLSRLANAQEEELGDEQLADVAGGVGAKIGGDFGSLTDGIRAVPGAWWNFGKSLFGK